MKTNMKIEETGPIRVNPKTIILFGRSKVGKTTALTMLPKNVILDFEKGTELHKATRVNMQYSNENYSSYYQYFEELQSWISYVHEQQIEHKQKTGKYLYHSVSIDTYDILYQYCCNYRLEQENAKIDKENANLPDALKKSHYVDMSEIKDFGASGSFSRRLAMSILQLLSKAFPRLIIVIQAKKELVDQGKVTIESKSSLLPPAAKTELFAFADATGYVYLSASEKMMISFIASEDTEAGARCVHLRGQHFIFDWDKIFLKQPTKTAEATEKSNETVNNETDKRNTN